MSVPFEIENVIVCDDIRREDNGKALLIGVYVGDILLRQVPATLTLSFFVLGKAQPHAETQELSLKIEIEQDADSRPILATAQITNTPDIVTDGTVVLTGVPLRIKEPTALVVSVQKGDGWREVMRKRIARMETSALTTSN